MSAVNNSMENGDYEEENDRRVKLCNPNVRRASEDVLYHFALSTKDHDFKEMFGDVKFVCVGGSPRRMGHFANFIMKELKYQLPAGQALTNIAKATDRYALYKIGPVLAASHGIGNASFSVMMHELIKALYHGQASDVCCFRLGTCGGIGLEPGSVVISEQAVDGLFRPQMELTILGKVVTRPSVLDKDLAEELVACSKPDDGFATTQGKTMCTMDFYEGQARLDGAFCDYKEEDKLAFLQECYGKGIRNIEMESLCFAAMCHQSNIKGAVACVTLLDRLKGDQIDTPGEVLKQWDERPANLVARFIKKRLNIQE